MKVRNSLAGLGMSAVLALGVGGAIAPGAQAAPAPTATKASVTAHADFTVTDSKTHRKTRGTAHKAGRSSQSVPPKRASLRCRNASISGRTFAVTCSGKAYRVYVNCSNRVRYITPVLSGSKRVVMRCPAGTRALGGGAYGR